MSDPRDDRADDREASEVELSENRSTARTDEAEGRSTARTDDAEARVEVLLAAAIEALGDNVESLARKVDVGEHARRNDRRIVKFLAVVLALALVALGGTAYAVRDNRSEKADQSDLEKVVEQLETQQIELKEAQQRIEFLITLVQEEAICPVYGYLILAFRRAPILPTATPQQNAERTGFIQRLENGYSKNQCVPPLELLPPN